MATLTVTATDRAGTVRADTGATANAASASGDKFSCTGAEMCIFNNTSVGAITVTEVMVATLDGQAVSSRTVSIPAGGIMVLGPWNPQQYADGNALVSFTYSANTGLKLTPFKLGAQ